MGAVAGRRSVHVGTANSEVAMCESTVRSSDQQSDRMSSDIVTSRNAERAAPDGVSPITRMTLTVAELLEHDVMRSASIVAGRGGLERGIACLNVMSVPDIVRWTRRDEFLLATWYPLPRDPDEFSGLVEQLSERGLAGLGVKLDQYMSNLAPKVLATADRLNFPVIIIPHETALDEVLSQAFTIIVNRQALALKLTHDFHHRLLTVALTGGGLALLVKELSDMLGGAAVAIVDRAGSVRAISDDRASFEQAGLLRSDGCIAIERLLDASSPTSSDAPWSVAKISAGGLEHGYVIAVDGSQRRLPFVRTTAVEQAALVAALEITRELAVASVERHFASNALHDLVTGGSAGGVDSVAYATTFGWNLNRTVSVIVARQHELPGAIDLHPRARELAALRVVNQWTSLVRNHDSAAAAAGFAAELVAVVDAGKAEHIARMVRNELVTTGLGNFSVGISGPGTAPDQIPRLYQEARVALAVGNRLTGAGAVTSYSRLGIYRLLCNVGPDDLRSFVIETLGPLLRLPQPSRSDLLTTLSALLENRCNVAETARTLHYHYNTMRYRVAKLEHLLGPFIDDAEASMRISVALRLLEMDEILGSLNASDGRDSSSHGRQHAAARQPKAIA